METYVKIKAIREGYDVRDIQAVSVGQLIEDLQAFPQDAKIVISFDGGYTYGGISYDNLCQVQVESKREEVERIKREEEEAESEALLCPYCESEDIGCSVNGGWFCYNCGEHFKKAKLTRFK